MMLSQPKKLNSSPRLLLVEDDPLNMEMLAGYLLSAGYQFDRATDGRAALDLLSRDPHRIDVVISDRRMPVMDGLELARHMKEDANLRGIPLIMQTAATTLIEVSEGIKAGVYYYLAKPFEEETLITLVKAAVRDREKNNNFEQRLVRQKDALSTIVNGEFHLKTPSDAENIAFLLGSLFPRPELAVSGLYELLINGIEHGNLKVGLEEKSRLLSTSGLEEEVHKRLNLPENTNKRVVVKFARQNGEVTVVITDEGDGFDWRPFMEIEPSRATKGNGRGIAKANLISFDKLTYNNKGNEVQVSASYY